MLEEYLRVHFILLCMIRRRVSSGGGDNNSVGELLYPFVLEHSSCLMPKKNRKFVLAVVDRNTDRLVSASCRGSRFIDSLEY